MNYGNNSASKPSSSYPHRTSYYSRSPHPTPYHPRLINTPPNVAYTATTSPQSNTHNHIKKNYHFSAKSSELFIKKKASISNNTLSRSSRFDAMPQGHVQLLSLGASTISFSSQHTPQSFIANNNTLSPPNVSPQNTSVSSTSASGWASTSGMMTEHSNKLIKNRKTRWNTKPIDIMIKDTNNNNNKRHRERYGRIHTHGHSTSWRRHRDKESVSRSRSRGRTKKHKKRNGNMSDSTEYVQSADIDMFLSKYRVNPKRKRNYAEEEIIRGKNRELSEYMIRRSTSNCNDDYNRDLNNSDYAMYEAPFKKPKFISKIGAFISSHSLPLSLQKRMNVINSNLLIYRNKKRKVRSEYILMERSQSQHWKLAPTKCWFLRCVYMLEGQVMTMCSSPEFCGGVSYPRKHLDEIEKKLGRIHPLPPLIYRRLFATLFNLSSLIRRHPNAVKWDRNKLDSIFEKAIRKQKQMMSIYKFGEDTEFIQYDFTPFKLPEFERNSISFYLNRSDMNCDELSTEYECDEMSTEDNDNNNDNNNNNNDNSLMMETPFNLNLDLVRKTKVALTDNSFVISPKIEKLVTANCVKMESQSQTLPIVKKKEIKKCIIKKKDKILRDIFKNNGVYGPIRAAGLTPTHTELPTLYQVPRNYQHNVSIHYLIEHYVDITNESYIRLLLPYFNVETVTNTRDNTVTNTITTKVMRKEIATNPTSIKRTFIGTVKRSQIVMEIYIDIDNISYFIRCKLNESKRHKLLCKLLRIKNKHGKRHKVCIPQPPPPLNSICVNFNWNGYCCATFCNKKHECSCCGEKHPARICHKQCIDYNWAKCHKQCPDNKAHCCSQCGDSKHPAWRCPYLHKCITQRYYAIYKTKKIRNGYFKLLQKKNEKKNMEWINRRKKSIININNNNYNNKKKRI